MGESSESVKKSSSPKRSEASKRGCRVVERVIFTGMMYQSNFHEDVVVGESSEGGKRMSPGKGKAKWASMTKTNYTYHGFSFTLVKSALQKHIRRGNNQQAMYAAMEMYSVSLDGGKPGVTNLINRLGIISSEDLSPINLSAALKTWEWVLNAKKNGFKLKELLNVVLYLSNAPKSRIASHVYRVYTTPALRKQYGLSEVPDYENVPQTFQTKLEVTEKQKRYSTLLNAFHYYLSERDYEAIYMCKLIEEEFKGVHLKKAYMRKKMAIAGIWDVLLDFVPKAGIMMDAYFDREEKRPMSTMVIMKIILGGEDTYLKEIPDYPIPDYDKIVSYDYELKIEDYMYDMHAGRQGDKEELRKQFTFHGAHVKNQDPRALIPEMKELYDNFVPE